MTTDTTEKGLESIIVRGLSGSRKRLRFPRTRGAFPMASAGVACTRIARCEAPPIPLERGLLEGIEGSSGQERYTHAAGGFRKTQPLTRPRQPAGLCSPFLRCAASYTRAFDHPPPRGLTYKKTPPPAGEAGRG